MAAQTGLDIVRSILIQYGLPSSMADAAWAQYTGSSFYGQAGMEDSLNQEFYQWLRGTQEYRAVYPVIDQLNANGKPISEADYLAYTRDIQQKVKQYGLPEGAFDNPQFIGRMLLADVSASEADERIARASSAVYALPESVKASFLAQGATNGDLVASWLNPDDSLAAIEQRLAKANVLGAATDQGVAVDDAQAARLAAQGVDYASASQGLASAAARRGLASGLGAAETISQSKTVDAVFGDAGASEALDRVTDARNKRFRGQGGAAATSTGVSGLGSR